jgi:hypothetical protein
MKYAIYSLDQFDLLRVVNILNYDSATEGFAEIADNIGGRPEWNNNLLNFRDINDPKYIIKPLDFIKRFTLLERVNIHERSTTHAFVRDMLYMISITDVIDLCSNDVVDGLAYLNSLGVLSPDRVIEIKGYIGS